MTPVVLRKGRFEVVIYTKDHSLPHVHVKSAEKEARITLDPVDVLDNWGFRPDEIRAILELVQAHQQGLLRKWNEFHAGR